MDCNSHNNSRGCIKTQQRTSENFADSIKFRDHTSALPPTAIRRSKEIREYKGDSAAKDAEVPELGDEAIGSRCFASIAALL